MHETELESEQLSVDERDKARPSHVTAACDRDDFGWEA